jgi:hypothetical protein
MQRENKQNTLDSRRNERGSALVMVLLIAILLMTAAAALILESSVNSANVTDATAEQQAYYAAEAGIQSSINALRHDTRPNPLIDPSKSPYPPDPDADPANKLDYIKAVRVSTSNATAPSAADCAGASPPLDCTARLSRWLNYGNNAAYPDRIVLGDAPAVSAYTPNNGFAYKVAVIDPDNVGASVTYNTQGIWTAPTPSLNNTFAAFGNQLTINDTTSLNSVIISYQSSSPYVKDVSSGEATTDFGKFVISGFGPSFATTGVTISSPVRFQINLNIVQPYGGVKVIRGYLERGTINSTSVGTVRLMLQSRDFVVFGSLIRLSGGVVVEEQIGDPGAPSGMDGVYRTGYEMTPVAPSAVGQTVLNGTISSPEPRRILIRATGFGPKGATKELESIIQKSYFDGLGAPSPLTLIGPPCTPVGACTPTNWAATPPQTRAPPNFIFDAGSSSGTYYSGKDKFLKEFLPPIGLTNEPNLEMVRAVIRRVYTPAFGGSVFGNPSNVALELPNWLKSPKKIEETLTQLRQVAQASGTYYGPGVTPPTSGGGRYGDFNTATGITYIDGDLEFSQDGGGILIVTGGLVFKGGFRFNGLILVTGVNGISRTGGGKGSLQGNMIVAPYTRVGSNSGLTCSDDISVVNKLDCFLAPRYDISGGGSSEIVYNSNNVTNGLNALTNLVKGVAEK